MINVDLFEDEGDMIFDFNAINPQIKDHGNAFEFVFDENSMKYAAFYMMNVFGGKARVIIINMMHSGIENVMVTIAVWT